LEAQLEEVCRDSDNEDIRDKYELGAVLGSGTFGQVREAILKESTKHEIRAVKMIEQDNETGEWSNHAVFKREVDLLQQINHENIIQFHDFYEDPHFLYVVMELCRGGEIFSRIIEYKQFGEKHAAFLGQQMLKATSYIHELRIIHRDIKAENFMLAESSITSCVKLIDFGMACKCEDGLLLSETCGSPHYMSPELIGQKYNHLADVWALGVLVYLILYGHYPFDDRQPQDIMSKILTEPIRWQTRAKLSRHALDFLRRALEPDVKRRATAGRLLLHPWIKLASHINVTAQTAAPEAEVMPMQALPSENLRSAHRKVTATRKQVDPKVELTRNEKLRKIDQEFKKGVRLGKRPEFVRRQTKITTAPSSRPRTSGSGIGQHSQRNLSGLVATTATNAKAAANQAAQSGTDFVPHRKQARSSSAAALLRAGTRHMSLPKTISREESIVWLNEAHPIVALPQAESQGSSTSEDVNHLT
jgi:myosin-light-chain kinase